MTTTTTPLARFAAAVVELGDYIRANPDGDTTARGRSLIDGLTREERDDALLELLVIRAKNAIREDTRQQEQAAQTQAARSAARAKSKETKHGSTDQYVGGVVRGCDCEECNGAREEFAAVRTRSQAAILAIFADFKQQCRIEWTRDLLDSQFARGDGTFVTWGEATREEHADRVEMFLANVHGNLEAASRHQAAIDVLDKIGAACLNEMATV